MPNLYTTLSNPSNAFVLSRNYLRTPSSKVSSFQSASGDRKGKEAVTEGDTDKGYPDVGAVPQLGLLPLRQPVPPVLLSELDDAVPDQSFRIPTFEGRHRGQLAVG